jgi:hypothetical protein
MPEIDLGMLLYLFVTIGGAGSLFVNAFYFPNKTVHWAGRNYKKRIPMSFRSKVALGIYFAYFLLPCLILVGVPESRMTKTLFFLGWAVLMVVVYREFRRDRREYEKSLPQCYHSDCE